MNTVVIDVCVCMLVCLYACMYVRAHQDGSASCCTQVHLWQLCGSFANPGLRRSLRRKKVYFCHVDIVQKVMHNILVCVCICINISI